MKEFMNLLMVKYSDYGTKLFTVSLLNGLMGLRV